MARLDWDRARSEKLVAERGSERLDLPSGRPPRQPAPIEQQNAAIARRRNEFRNLSYSRQLAYLTELRRHLAKLQASDDAAAQTIKAQFKPLLKKAVTAPPTPATEGEAVSSARGAIRPAGHSAPGQRKRKRKPKGRQKPEPPPRATSSELVPRATC